MNVNIEAEFASFRAEPEHGLPVTFEVRLRDVETHQSSWPYRRVHKSQFVVGLKGSDGSGFAHYRSFERACSSALSRARRYERAYSKPRGLVSA